MDTYTLFTTPLNVIKKKLPFKYSMELNKSDMVVLLESLRIAANSNEIIEEEQDEIISLRSSILETIGIEEI